MKRVIALAVLMLLVLSIAVVALAANGYVGPSSNAGDGISDGSEFDAQPGPFGDADPLGPAPNSGDGVSDGSGLDTPNSP
ncbi:hypothetical protein JW848_05705 [Candidatus Bipolaricaulota bacterium]|nr:hypothetical protein [Candidatus Bipolaricaulota bacterium]